MFKQKTAADQRIYQNSGVIIETSAKMTVQKSNNLQLRSPNSSESVQMHYTAVCFMASLLFLINIIGRINCPEGYHRSLSSMP